MKNRGYMIALKKKEKEKEYTFKNNHGKKIARVIIWIMLGFFFIRGIIVSLRPDQTREVNEMISEFKESFKSYKDQDAEIMSFAQNFCKEYLTYSINQSEEYQERLKKYVSSNFLRVSDITDSKGNALVTYAQAYRKEEYSQSQVDVYVLVEVEYRIPQVNEDGSSINEEIVIKELLLKVPVYINGKSYIVEDLPLFVADDVKISQYEATEYREYELSSDAIKDAITRSLGSFFKSYYEGKQDEINYYLTKDADSNEFLGLSGRMKFDKIESLRCYQKEGDEYITCIVKIKIIDSANDVRMSQQFNLTVKKEADKYYVKSMGTKTINLN